MVDRGWVDGCGQLARWIMKWLDMFMNRQGNGQVDISTSLQQLLHDRLSSDPLVICAWRRFPHAASVHDITFPQNTLALFCTSPHSIKISLAFSCMILFYDFMHGIVSQQFLLHGIFSLTFYYVPPFFLSFCMATIFAIEPLKLYGQSQFYYTSYTLCMLLHSLEMALVLCCVKLTSNIIYIDDLSCMTSYSLTMLSTFHCITYFLLHNASYLPFTVYARRQPLTTSLAFKDH